MPRGGTTHNELSPPILIINQENALRACPRANFGDIFSVKVPSSQMTPACVKLTKN